jgi:DNA-binding protein Fis
MPKQLREEINDVVVKYLEYRLQTDDPVNVVAMANEMVQSLVDVIMQLDEYHQAPALASLIATLGDEYLSRRGLIRTERRDN